MKISELLLKYKTDKNYGTVDPALGHCYGESYDKIFQKFNKDDNLNLLEVGIQKGGSLIVWKEFFKNSNIYGIDIIDEIIQEYKRDDIKYIFSDVKNNSVLEKLKKIKFDIIIDDGSHYLEDVLFVVSNFLSLLNDDGVLIIEDCQEPENWIVEISRIIPHNFELSSIDLRNVNGHYDDFLITIQKIKK
jgi:SAM-dependent methyltransferase